MLSLLSLGCSSPRTPVTTAAPVVVEETALPEQVHTAETRTSAETGAATETGTTADTAIPSVGPTVTALGAPGPPTCGATGAAWFQDVTLCAGLASAIHVSMPPSTSSFWQTTGEVFVDLDGDGWLDVVTTSPFGGNHLFLGSPSGVFTERADAALANLSAGGASAVDVDNDGWTDLFLAGREWGDSLLMNQAGMALAPPTPAFPGHPGQGQGGVWADIDGDGQLEVYIHTYVMCLDCPNDLDQGRDALLVRDATTGQWTDRIEGLLTDDKRATGLGFAAGWGDFDSDGDLDLYVANDKGGVEPPDPSRPLRRNAYWRNDGPGCTGTCFTEVAEVNGTGLLMDSMGVSVGDYDNDGDLDIAVSNLGPQVLLQNQGDGTFVEVAEAAGIGLEFTGWGVTWLDIDNDGWLDLFMASTTSDRLWRNQGDGTFVDVSVSSGVEDARQTLGAAAGDYDRDGHVDLLLGDVASGYRLLRNVHDEGHNWIGLRLVGDGSAGGRSAIGARVWVTDSSGRTQLREVRSGTSMGSGDDLGVHFGLGPHDLVSVEVRWPDGTMDPLNVPENVWSTVAR